MTPIAAAVRFRDRAQERQERRPASVAETQTPAKSAVWRRSVAGAAIALGALAVAFLAYVIAFASLQEGRTQDVLYAQLRSELSHGVAPVGGPVEVGKPVALLAIPRLGLRDVVVEGADSATLTNGPGHEGGTPLPGQPGTAVVLGRRSTYGAPFRHVDRLQVGDSITVTTGQGRFDYVVDAMWRSTQSHLAPASVGSRLTLVTSDPLLVPSRSLVVTAALRGSPAAAAPLTAARADDTPLTASGGGGIEVYLWAQALLVLALASTWAWHRWPRTAVWVAGVPLAVVVVWNLFDSAAALLPNTL